MTRRRVLLATAMVGVLWSVSGCAGRAVGGGSTAPPPSGDLATRVEEQGNRYPDQYAGLEVTPDGIVVYRKPGGGLDAAVRAVVAGANISFRDASHTRAELTPLAERITADAEYWKAQGIPVWSVAVRHDGSGVEVGTPAGDRLLVAARIRYGATAPIIVQPMTSQPSTLPLGG